MTTNAFAVNHLLTIPRDAESLELFGGGSAMPRLASRDAIQLIPAALDIDCFCPGPSGDGADTLGQAHQPIPSLTAAVHNRRLIRPDPKAQLVLTNILPHILHRVQFGAVGWQAQQRQVLWNPQPLGRVPAGSVHDQRAMRSRANMTADLLQVTAHRRLVGKGLHQADPDGPRRADGPEQIRPGVTPVARRTRARAPLGPEPCQPALLTNPRLILEPDLERLAGRVFRQGRAYQGREVFLNASWAAGSLAGC